LPVARPNQPLGRSDAKGAFAGQLSPQHTAGGWAFGPYFSNTGNHGIVRVEVIDDLPIPVGSYPNVGDMVP